MGYLGTRPLRETPQSFNRPPANSTRFESACKSIIKATVQGCNPMHGQIKTLPTPNVEYVPQPTLRIVSMRGVGEVEKSSGHGLVKGREWRNGTKP